MLPDVLYCGTTRDYHDRALQKHGIYRPLDRAENVQLKTDISGAFGDAVTRGNSWDGLVILVVRRDGIRGLRSKVGFECDFLDPDWYAIVGLEVENYTLSGNTKHRLESTRDAAMRIEPVVSL